MTWDNARSTCQSDGGDLVSILDNKKAELVLGMISNCTLFKVNISVCIWAKNTHRHQNSRENMKHKQSIKPYC